MLATMVSGNDPLVQFTERHAMDFQYSDLAKMVDHALLTPTTTVEQLEQGCRLAIAYDVASVCIMPFYLARCAEILAGSSVMPSTVVGFPLGGHTTAVKEAEATQAVADGCQELDMVVNISKVLSKDWNYVRNDIRAVVEIAHASDRKVKVIFENCYLEDQHKIRLCEICGEVNADWVKTSTGFGTGGATLDDLRLMRAYAPEHVQVKAAGGVRDVATMKQVHDIGATRVGTSSTQKLMNAFRAELGMEPIVVAAAQSSGGY